MFFREKRGTSKTVINEQLFIYSAREQIEPYEEVRLLNNLLNFNKRLQIKQGLGVFLSFRTDKK